VNERERKKKKREKKRSKSNGGHINTELKENKYGE